MRLFADNATSTLASAIDASVTTITLATGEGAKFPSPSGGDFFDLTLTQALSESSWEIVKVTARTDDTLTVTRGQYGTTAASWASGSKAENRIHKAAVADFATKQSSIYTITDGSSVDINPANGEVQLWTLGASRTPTASSFENGQSVVLMIDDGTAYAITWTIVTTWVGGTAPTLPTTGYGVIVLWKVAGVIYGAYVGDA